MKAIVKASKVVEIISTPKSVTIDGSTHNLPQPFFVIATQNPTEQVGTYPLPESQLRFW